MKTWTLPPLAACLSLSLLGSIPAAGKDPGTVQPEGKPRLQLIITLDLGRNAMEARQASENMARHVHQTFRTQGYKGEIDHVSREKAAPEATTLALHVTKWDVDRSGSLECTFVAVLFRAGAPAVLGEFTTPEMSGAGGDPLRRVAERSLRKLAELIRDQNLLPGFTAKKIKG